MAIHSTSTPTAPQEPPSEAVEDVQPVRPPGCYVLTCDRPAERVLVIADGEPGLDLCEAHFAKMQRDIGLPPDAMSDALVGALVPLCPDCGGAGWVTETVADEDGSPVPEQAQCDHHTLRERIAAVPSEARDKMLLGFALRELLQPGMSVRVSDHTAYDDGGCYVVVTNHMDTWQYDSEGRTMLDAIRAALKDGHR